MSKSLQNDILTIQNKDGSTLFNHQQICESYTYQPALLHLVNFATIQMAVLLYALLLIVKRIYQQTCR